jgi:hypothetical protein
VRDGVEGIVGGMRVQFDLEHAVAYSRSLPRFRGVETLINAVISA